MCFLHTSSHRFVRNFRISLWQSVLSVSFQQLVVGEWLLPKYWWRTQLCAILFVKARRTSSTPLFKPVPIRECKQWTVHLLVLFKAVLLPTTKRGISQSILASSKG